MAETTTETDAPREAALRVMARFCHGEFTTPDHMADAILSAVVPLVREQVLGEIIEALAAEIDSETELRVSVTIPGLHHARATVQRIARGGSQ